MEGDVPKVDAVVAPVGVTVSEDKTVNVAETGKKMPVWSVSTSCARTPLIVHFPAARPAGTSWLSTMPLCQFSTTAEREFPGLVHRTSENVSGVRLDPEMVVL